MKTVFVWLCVFGMSCSDVAVAGGKDVRTERASEPRPKRPGKYPVEVEDYGSVFKYRDKAYSSVRELLKALDTKKYYDVAINFKSVNDEVGLRVIRELMAAGMKVNFVKFGRNNGMPRFVEVEQVLSLR
ncbi:hypothetical protein [Akkermansia glycaniphila]|uniref:Uncharacterized protein n=1 Tax=Akkermansia glycaniphila TaxID=1679444 RepID=A0A1C7P8N2_9BACT|nr:hypothetical protein [Akkermansia glycaniphila]OCA01931.1 hypothetical protein AC781_12035 [Akkermansia glycaniphila]SEH92071.1 Hypothetical protein PYTT_1731 [Akkermansia glycaniphila]